MVVCPHHFSRSSFPVDEGDWWVSDEKKRKGHMSGQVRQEELLAEAVVIGQEVNSGGAKRTFRPVCMQRICRRCLQGMCVVVWRRLRRVMERTSCWPSMCNWSKIQSCGISEKKTESSNMKEKKPAVQFEEPGEDSKQDEDSRMEVDDDAGYRKDYKGVA